MPGIDFRVYRRFYLVLDMPPRNRREREQKAENNEWDGSKHWGEKWGELLCACFCAVVQFRKGVCGLSLTCFSKSFFSWETSFWIR